MVKYNYSIKTERNDKGKPEHTYEGERNVSEGIRVPAIKQISCVDEMVKKITPYVEELMRYNPHISKIEIKVEEIK